MKKPRYNSDYRFILLGLVVVCDKLFLTKDFDEITFEETTFLIKKYRQSL